MKNAYHEMLKSAEIASESDFLSQYPGCESVFTAVRRTMPDICQESGLTGRDICRRYGISYRTMEDWTSGRRTCPVYLRLMIQESLGIYSAPQF